MVIVAHPDDIEFGCAGTVAQWVLDGAQICYVLCTSGDVGIAEAGMNKARATESREREQLAAAAPNVDVIVDEAAAGALDNADYYREARRRDG